MRALLHAFHSVALWPTFVARPVTWYTYRHSFVTDALENGVCVAQVAELLGHTSADMVMPHFQHLRGKREHLKQAAIQATQGNGNQAGPAPKVG